jgi:radical SAM superfamily enzyme YgiQ (UPF0313 family)
MKVLLINPPYLFDKKGGYVPNNQVWKPLGILYLASVLKKEGISVYVIDMMPKEIKLPEVLKFIRQNGIGLVGITGTTPQIRGIVQLGKAIKDKFGSKVTVGLGGPHASSDSGFLKAFPCFDFQFIGEGELTFPKLLKEIDKGKKIKGVITGESPVNLDDLPLPDYHLLADEDFSGGPHGSAFVTMHTTRGCPFRCIYCSSPVEQRSKVRYRSANLVVDEVEQRVKEGTKFVIFTDDTFTLNKERVKKICQGMIDRGISVKWNCETRASLVDEELLSLMKKAGCVEIFFGVESGNERIRNEIINKKVSNADLYKAFSLCRKLKITTDAFLMAGFPTETKKELNDTAEFVFKAKPDIIGIHITGILPGAGIFPIALKEGKIKKTTWHDFARGLISEQPIYIPDGMTQEDLDIFQKNLYRRFYFRPVWLWRRFIKSVFSIRQLRTDLMIAWQLLTKGRAKARSYREEDYLNNY